jgi:hypothetical protein
MKTKRFALLAATGVTVLASSLAFAAGSGVTGSTNSGTDATMGATPGGNIGADAGSKAGAHVGTSADASAGTGGGLNAGGMSASRMSAEGAANTNGVTAGDRDKGLARAEDRSSAQTGVGGVQPNQTEGQGSTSKSTRHHRVGKTPKTPPEGSKSSPDGY